MLTSGDVVELDLHCPPDRKRACVAGWATSGPVALAPVRDTLGALLDVWSSRTPRCAPAGR